MSKVYGFRLRDDNPREVQAREVIEALVMEGYSLQQDQVWKGDSLEKLSI